MNVQITIVMKVPSAPMIMIMGVRLASLMMTSMMTGLLVRVCNDLQIPIQKYQGCYHHGCHKGAHTRLLQGCKNFVILYGMI